MEKFKNFILEHKGKLLILLALLLSLFVKKEFIDVTVVPGPTPDTIIIKNDSFPIEEGFDMVTDSIISDTSKL